VTNALFLAAIVPVIEELGDVHHLIAGVISMWEVIFAYAGQNTY